MASTLGAINPLRYRGYVYDNESELYYLQSRYYNPELCRFINADDVSMLGADGNIIGVNLFAYCDNNPVNKSDPTGKLGWLAGGIIGGVLGAVAAVVTGGSATDILIGAAAGFAAGAVASTVGLASLCQSDGLKQAVKIAGSVASGIAAAVGAVYDAKCNGVSNGNALVAGATAFCSTTAMTYIGTYIQEGAILADVLYNTIVGTGIALLNAAVGAVMPKEGTQKDFSSGAHNSSSASQRTGLGEVAFAY